MQASDKVVITNRFHAYAGFIGTITSTASDDDGDILFVRFQNGKEIMLEPSDVELAS